MPRGPGKKSNYNLDYSRFNGVNDEAEEHKVKVRSETPEVDDDSEIKAALANMPPALQEAYRMMALAKSEGDEGAQKRAQELAMMAVKSGSPDVQKGFLKEITKHIPDASESAVAKELGLDPAVANEVEPSRSSPEELGSRIDTLKSEMEKNQEATRKQLEQLQKQQEALERIRSPEDVMKFMHEGGMTEDDLRRIFSGDAEHMNKCVNGMIDTALPRTPGLDKAEETLKAVEQLHAGITGEKLPESTATPATKAIASTSQRAPELVPEPIPEVKIPEHRLQYQKDDDGRYTAVELKCKMPGVADMSAITLDISEKHLRLSTSAPAPKYAVNAGPFPVLIDPASARAKFSKKREELSIFVPAK